MYAKAHHFCTFLSLGNMDIAEKRLQLALLYGNIVTVAVIPNPTSAGARLGRSTRYQ